MALVLPPPEQPKEVKATEEHSLSCRALGIWVCIALGFALSSIFIYGLTIMTGKCRRSFSTSSQTTVLGSPAQHRREAIVPVPQTPLHAVARPNFKDTRSTESTCPPVCGSLHDHRPSIKQPQLIQQQIRVPSFPASMPITGNMELQDPLPIAQLCLQQYSDQQKSTDSHLPSPPAGLCKSQKQRFLLFWKRS